MTAAAHASSTPGEQSHGLRLDLGGEAVLCRPSGVLWIESSRSLIVADLHLEKASWFAARGQMLPPYDSADTLRRLSGEVAALDPEQLILLGDSFHDPAGDGRLARGDIDTLRRLASGRRLMWVTGNHDPLAPRDLPGEAASHLVLGGLRLVHEPTRETVAGEVAGHLHPCARVRGAGASVRRRCFITDGQRLIVPAFGALAGGLNVRDPAFRGLLRPKPLVAVLGFGRIHAVGWSSLRDD